MEHVLIPAGGVQAVTSGRDDIVVVVSRIKNHRLPDLLLIADAVGGLSAVSRLIQCRQQHACKNRNDRNDDEELYQGEEFALHGPLS